MNNEKMTDREKHEILREQWLENMKQKLQEKKNNIAMFKKYGSGYFIYNDIKGV